MRASFTDKDGTVFECEAEVEAIASDGELTYTFDTESMDCSTNIQMNPGSTKTVYPVGLFTFEDGLVKIWPSDYLTSFGVSLAKDSAESISILESKPGNNAWYIKLQTSEMAQPGDKAELLSKRSGFPEPWQNLQITVVE